MFSKEQRNQEGQNFRTLGLGFTNVRFYRPIIREGLVNDTGEGFGLSAQEMVVLHEHYGNNTEMRVDFIIVDGKTLYQPTNIGDELVSEKHLTDAGLEKQEGAIVFSGSDAFVARLDSKKQ